MVEEKKPHTPGFSAEPITDGYSLAQSRLGFNPGLYFEENLDRGLGSADASSMFSYGLNRDCGGVSSSAFVKGKGLLKDRVPSEDAAADLFSSIGLPNSSEDLCWDFDFTRKFPDLDNQFRQVSGSWNSGLVSQTCGSSNNPVPASVISSQFISGQNNQPQGSTSYNMGGNYMTSFGWDMLRHDETTGATSSYSCDPQFIGDIRNIVNPVDTSGSYHFSNNGYFGTTHANNLMMAPPTSLSLQYHDASIHNEGTTAVDHSMQAVSMNKPAYSYNLQDFSEVRPMDTNTSEYIHWSNGGYLGTSHHLDHLSAPSSSFPVQRSDAGLVDRNIKLNDHSLLSVLLNKPMSSRGLQDLTEPRPLNSGAAHDSQDRGETGPVDEDTKADHQNLQGVSVNPEDSSNVQDIGQVNIAASPLDTRDSNHGSNEGQFGGSARDLNLLGKSFTSMFMQFSDPILDEDTEPEDPLWEDLLPVDSIGEPISVSTPVGTGESNHHSSDSYNFEFHPQGLSGNSVFMKETEVNPMVEDTEEGEAEDDPTLKAMLIEKRAAKGKKVRPYHRQKRVPKPCPRCSNDPPATKKRRPRKRDEEATASSNRKHVEAKSQNKRGRKRIKDGAMDADDAVPRRSTKQELDSDDEYDPYHSDVKAVRSRKGERKNNKIWTLSEVVKLVDGVSQFGVGKWTAIQRTFSGPPPCRSSLDIRDKWRNLIRTSGLRLKYMKKEDEYGQKYGSVPLPKSLLEKICELDKAQPYLRSGVTLAPQNELVDSSSTE